VVEILKAEELLVISFTKIASDVRVNRHIQHLAQEFKITSIGYGPPPLNVARHIEIPGSLRYLPLSLFGIIRLLFNLMGKFGLKSEAVKYVGSHLTVINPKLVLINDVQCLPLIDSLDSTSIKIVDMHEYAPLEMEDDWRFKILLQRYYGYLCERYLRQSDAVVTVSEGLAQRYSLEFGVNVEVVMNARDYVDSPSNSNEDDVLRLVHTGLAARGRHLENMIRAVDNLPGVSLSLYLVEAPRQKRTLKKLQRICALSDNCVIERPVASADLPSTIAQYDAGFLYIYPSNFSLKHSLPNKLFDCIQARRPVIVGPAPDLSEFVRKFDVGFVAESFESVDVRALVLRLDKQELLKKRSNLEFAATNVNAQSECGKLLSIIKRVIQLSADGN
jgi:hypothetical protein